MTNVKDTYTDTESGNEHGNGCEHGYGNGRRHMDMDKEMDNETWTRDTDIDHGLTCAKKLAVASTSIK
jgi:hypothetical protein